MNLHSMTRSILCALHFAQSTLDFGAWVNLAMLFLNATVAITTIASVNRTAKREVKFAFQPASKDELDRLVADHAQSLEAFRQELASLREDMRRDLDQILLAGENRVCKLHERIDVILETVSELRGRIYELHN